MATGPTHVGLDVGTQGIRAVLMDERGAVVSRAHQALALPPPGPVQEQDPAAWWEGVITTLRSLGPARATSRSLAVSCTSGTLCILDRAGDAVVPAMLYSDTRGSGLTDVDASWAVAKLAWLAAEAPSLLELGRMFTTPGGYLTGRLLGHTAPIDETQALKLGYDPETRAWTELPVGPDALPDVVPMGTLLGTIGSGAAAATGLPTDLRLVAGITDGVAAQLACQPSPGSWATAVGTTMVWKTVALRNITSVADGVYSHRGPGGWWLPGAASNAGGGILSTWASNAQLDDLARTVSIEPHGQVAYPSTARGERFPFVDLGFAPWSVEVGTSPADRYRAELVGAAFVERWGCERLVELGCDQPWSVATTGGATRSPVWTQLRADVLEVPLRVPVEPGSAFGAAIVASASALGGVLAAVDALVTWRSHFHPEPRRADAWSEDYDVFRQRCLAPR
jgi:sugar (pentulose or hexulose) kinase